MFSVDAAAAECSVPNKPPTERSHARDVPTAALSPPRIRNENLAALRRLETAACNELKMLQAGSITAVEADDWLKVTIAWDLGLRALPTATGND
ncbi:MAG: hypothetical protein ACOH1V_00855 [Stenotrophomonas sp.]